MEVANKFGASECRGRLEQVHMRVQEENICVSMSCQVTHKQAQTGKEWKATGTVNSPTTSSIIAGLKNLLSKVARTCKRN